MYTRDAHAYEKLATLFFTMRQKFRSHLPAGKTIDPNAWMRCEALRFIAKSDHLTMHQLAHFLHIKAPSATSFISHLEKQHLVMREQSTDDKRVMFISLTPAGKKQVASYKGHSKPALVRMFSNLTDRDIDSLVHILQKVVDDTHE